jgi:hypothetical protein
MNAAVQFVRNALCCIKDLEIYRDSVLYDAKYLRSVHGYDYPPYTDKTTPLEALISIAQFYVFATGVPAALSLIWLSVGKLQRIQRLLERKNRSASGGGIQMAVEKLLLQSLLQEATTALKSVAIGFNLFFISAAFLWLAANSWHVTETAEILGGLPALIHALTVMNICLTPLLYYMYQDANRMIRRGKTLEATEYHWVKRGLIVEKEITLPVLEALTGWRPFWDAGTAPVLLWRGTVLPQQEQEQWKLEIGIVQNHLDDITGKSLLKQKKTDSVVVDNKETNTNNNALLEQHANEMADQLHVKKRLVWLEGYREYFFLLVNTIAWYGYGVCILIYYYPHTADQPAWLRTILWYGNDPRLLDWRGNFAGDFMWTIEPLVVLTSPWYLTRLQQTITVQQQRQKQKQLSQVLKDKED